MKRIAGLLALMLVACGPQAPAGNDAVAAPVETPQANATTPPFAKTPNAHPTAPEPAPIPAKFRGIWAETKDACGELDSGSRLVVSGRTVRTQTAVLVGKTFTFPVANQFALDGNFEENGQAGAAHYSIDKTGNLLTDEAGGGMVRVRCG